MVRADDVFFLPNPPRAHGMLDVGEGHAIHWRITGPEQGLPVVSCHGGPGGSSLAGASRLINTKSVQLIQFDQRGCGLSTPRGALHANTLQNTVADMERLRIHLGIERWLVSGGSWGSTVALAYGEAHPDRCLGLFLVSLWLCRARDIHWWFHGVRDMFPELWDQFANLVPESERSDLRGAYCRRILGEDDAIAREAATQLYLYEEGFMHFDAPLQPPNVERGYEYGRIFAHYAAHDFFLDEDQLLRDADRLARLPITLITGRYDCCTTPANAWDLKLKVPHARLEIVPGAGHYPTELAFGRAVAKAGAAMVAALLDGDPSIASWETAR